MERLGFLAAFGTAICWSFSAIFFEKASLRSGTLAVNFWKVVFAFVFLTITGTVLRGMPLPLDASPHAWLFLALSGLIGFVVADFFLFNAYVMIGARVTVVFQALTPIFTALLAFVFLGERMKAESIAAMFVVVAGILIVVISRNLADKARVGKTHRVPLKGYTFAFFSSVFQATGLIFSKVGLGDYDAVSGTQIRVMTAIAGFGLQALISGRSKAVFTGLPRDPISLRATATGSVFGPFLGVALSLFALQNTQAGAASTLMALTPVLIIPPAILILKQKVRPAEIAGAVLAVCGAALFFML
ncbi:MAG: DMT family transporter [Rectinema sp.]